ncbi:hypothetical protein LT493_15450 [Streptomyces tricolor]|nr:hypothetical protein [Streptomyces tricolor]
MLFHSLLDPAGRTYVNQVQLVLSGVTDPHRARRGVAAHRRRQPGAAHHLVWQGDPGAAPGRPAPGTVLRHPPRLVRPARRARGASELDRLLAEDRQAGIDPGAAP